MSKETKPPVVAAGDPTPGEAGPVAAAKPDDGATPPGLAEVALAMALGPAMVAIEIAPKLEPTAGPLAVTSDGATTSPGPPPKAGYGPISIEAASDQIGLEKEVASTLPTASPAQMREPDEDSLRLAEALVFASAEPVTPRGLARLLADDIDADAVLAALRKRYVGRGVELVDAGNGVMFRSAVDLAPRLRKVIDLPRRLPRVALETLAIVAYHQPMTRPEIEHIRGTALSQQTLDALLELNLIAPKGRRETPGRPTLWGTTPEFLAHFGLKDLRELPRREDLLLETAPPKAIQEVLPPDLQSPPEHDS